MTKRRQNNKNRLLPIWNFLRAKALETHGGNGGNGGKEKGKRGESGLYKAVAEIAEASDGASLLFIQNINYAPIEGESPICHYTMQPDIAVFRPLSVCFTG